MLCVVGDLVDEGVAGSREVVTIFCVPASCRSRCMLFQGTMTCGRMGLTSLHRN